MELKIGVVGLGKLGLCSALCFAKAGFKVRGFDISKKVVESIKKKKIIIKEPEVIKYLNNYKNNIEVSSDINILRSCKIIFVVLPTPSKKNWEFSNSYIINFLKEFSKLIYRENKKFHIVISSTVMPGSCIKFIKFIEKKLDYKINKQFFFSYNPEFIALGSVIKNFLNPDLVLIGSSNNKAANELVSIYKKTLRTYSFCKMSIESAEITKIALNSYCTLKISFANLIMRISNKVKNSKATDICSALGFDKRISPYYLTPGLPFAGPCFPRDNQAFNFFQKKIRLKDNYITNATILSNNSHIKFLNEKIYSVIKSNKIKNILILGVTFKPNTPITEMSYTLELIKFLRMKKITFKIFDKNVSSNDYNYNLYSKYLVKTNNTKQEKFDLIIDTIKRNKINFNKKKYLNLWNM
jgi:UDPglucose 6-dehydrogenase